MKKIHIFCLLALFCFIIIQPVDGKDDNKKVRVGYVNGDGYILHDDSSGRTYGYGVNYLDEIKSYTNWNTEYLGASMSGNIERLEKGEIDVIACVQKGDDNDDRFEFTVYPMGTVKSVIYSVNNDDKIFYEDYKDLTGRKIGYVSDTVQQYSLENYMSDKNMIYSAVAYESMDDLLEAVDKEKIDFFVTSSLQTYTGYNIIDMFDPQPVFFMGRAGEEYIDELNQAIASKKTVEPDFDINLFKEFFRSDPFITEPLYKGRI